MMKRNVVMMDMKIVEVAARKYFKTIRGILLNHAHILQLKKGWSLRLSISGSSLC